MPLSLANATLLRRLRRPLTTSWPPRRPGLREATVPGLLDRPGGDSHRLILLHVGSSFPHARDSLLTNRANDRSFSVASSRMFRALDSLRQTLRCEYDDKCLPYLDISRRLNLAARCELLRTVAIDVASEYPPIASYEAGAGEIADPGAELHLSTRLPGDSSHLHFSPGDVASAQ